MDSIDSLYVFRSAYHGVSTIHPLALLLLIACGLTMLAVQRKYVVLPMLLLACFVAPAQRVVVLGFDFDMLRILVLLGWFRLIVRQETNDFVWKPIDKVMVAWALSGALAFILLRGTSDAVINRLGASYDSLGMYFLFRCLVRDMEDVKQIVVWLVYLSIPVALFLYIEKQTGRNIFSVFGGVPEITGMREGKLRAQGAFAHSIIAGSFWVVQLPLFIALWWQEGKKHLVPLAVTASLFIVYASASSTPAAGVFFVVLGGGFYLLRQQMQAVRWGLLLGLVGLHLVMKAPVWHLIARVDLVGGSTGYHRFMLIDQTIHRFSEWWLLGTRSTAHWGHYLFDTANMYVGQAVGGGIVTLLLFVAVIALAFQGIGSLLASSEENIPEYILAWALGVALFTHCMLFIGVAYFGQITLVWSLLLAVIGSLTPVAQTIHAMNNNLYTGTVRLQSLKK